MIHDATAISVGGTGVVSVSRSNAPPDGLTSQGAARRLVATSDGHPKQVQLPLRDAGHDRSDVLERRPNRRGIIHVDAAGLSAVAKLAASRYGPLLVSASNHDEAGKPRREVSRDVRANESVAADDKNVARARHRRFARLRRFGVCGQGADK